MRGFAVVKPFPVSLHLAALHNQKLTLLSLFFVLMVEKICDVRY